MTTPCRDLVVPSPLGVGLVLGLIPTWRTNRWAEPGRVYRVVQAPAGEAFAHNLLLLCDLAMRDGLANLYEVVPWPRFTAGPVGTVEVTGCEQHPKDPYPFHLEFAHPTPAWQPSTARQGELAFSAPRAGLALAGPFPGAD